MKIRIKGNSVRLRLTKTEVENFCEAGYFEEHTQFPNSVFTYALQRKENIRHIEADFVENKMIVTIPKSMVTDWSTNDKIGFEHYYSLPDQRQLFVLIEKDFTCLDQTIEDQSDNYPNPLALKK